MITPSALASRSDDSSAKLLLNEEKDVFVSTFRFPRPAAGGPAIERIGNGEDPWQLLDDATFLAPDLAFLDGLFDFTGWSDDQIRADSAPATGRNTPILPLDEATLERQCGGNRLSDLVSLIADGSENNVLADLHFLFHRPRVEKFLANYFASWHRNCRIIHRASLASKPIPLALMASIVFLGAMYSQIEHERAIATGVMDHAEAYVFSQQPFCKPTDTVEIDLDSQFRNIQAGFTMM